RPYTQPGTPETEADRRDRERVAAHDVARLAGIEWLGGTTNVTTDPFAALPPWERPASGSGGAGGGGGGGSSAADTAAERIRDRVAELQREIEAQDRLMAALGEGEDAYRRMEATIRAETDALRLGIDLTGEQGQAFIDLSVAADESNQRTRDMLGLISDANAAMRQFAPAVDTVAEAQAALNAAIEAGVGDVDAYRAALETAKKQAEFSSKANQEALEGQLDAMRRQQDFQDGLTSGAVEWADAIRAGGDELDKMLAGLEDWDDIFYQTVVRPWVERQFSGLFGPVASGAGSLGLFGGGGVPANDNSGGGGWLSGLTGWFDRVFGSLPGFAHGTSSAPAGWAWVGENGPELVRFRGRESVTPLRTALGPSILDSLFADRFHGLASGGGIGGALLAGPNALLNGFFGLLGAGGDVITEFLSLFLGAGRGRSAGGAPDPYSAMVAGRGGSPGMASGPGLLRGLLDLVPAFDGGGSFFAGAGLPRIPSSGIDDRLLIARTHVGERWQATPRGQVANATTTMIDAPVNVNMTFPNSDVDDVRRNEVSVRRMLMEAIADVHKYGPP
ncbi:MAG: hypothetical protein KDA49_09775, partial [Rhodospirillaceae bacterium]|nr:hypothetical protein [Rhodospirillaceae bacterium]